MKLDLAKADIIVDAAWRKQGIRRSGRSVSQFSTMVAT
jgi:hypothetical protein